MRIVALEPYETGSHRNWLRGFARASQHEVVPLTLEGQFWRWRMHGGAVTLARRYLQDHLEADLLLATDMLDLSTFLALTREVTHNLPVALYMHENQLTYPMRPGEKRDLHYGFINYASMLCADAVLFNSSYHLELWFDELPRLLKHFPDHNELDTIARLRQRASVLPLGLELLALETAKPAEPRQGPLLILWNHRWEYDKNPRAFLNALYALAGSGAVFEVALLGEHFVSEPPEFEEARERLGSRIVHQGYAPSREEYARWLWEADIVVSTALHDFFGAAVVEAIYCDCLPLLPNRLAYPQFIPPEDRNWCLYDRSRQLIQRLRWAADHVQETRARSLQHMVAAYDWSQIAPVYDAVLAELVERPTRVTL